MYLHNEYDYLGICLIQNDVTQQTFQRVGSHFSVKVGFANI